MIQQLTQSQALLAGFCIGVIVCYAIAIIVKTRATHKPVPLTEEVFRKAVTNNIPLHFKMADPEQQRKELDRILNSRPNLAYITRLSGLTKDEIAGYYPINGVFKDYTPEQKKAFDMAIARVPELVCIAQMFFDKMIGTSEENSIPFICIDKTLKEIAACEEQV